MVAGVAVAGCPPRCLKGHDEPVWVPRDCYTRMVEVTEHISMPVQDCTEAHWGKQFVCEQYELEKLPPR